MKKVKTGVEIARDYCKKFPTTPTLTIAKKIFKENKDYFLNLESARSAVRKVRGMSGQKKRETLRDKSLYKPLEYKYNPFDLPDSYSVDFSPYEISQSRTLILSDIHIPYHDVKALELAIKYGIDKNANCVLLNGDLIDMPNHSRHERCWRSRSTTEEFEKTRHFLRSLRKAFPKAKIVFKEGNHCERWEKWLYVKAPEIFDDPEFKLESRLRLGELGIDIVKDKRPVKIGKLTVLHGHELAGGSGGVNPSRSTFLKTLDSCVVGHFHKTSSHVETTMSGHVIDVNSIGCLCDMNPMFMRINKWNLGFAFVELDIKTGEYIFHNKKIVKNKVY
jgi:predicted phosphodiesterase